MPFRQNNAVEKLMFTNPFKTRKSTKSNIKQEDKMTTG